MTKLEFDETQWDRIILKPTWYLDFTKMAERAKETFGEGSDELHQLNKKTRHFFEEALKTNLVVLAGEGPDLDKERQPIDTIVIHHTSAKPGYRLSYMEATQLLNIYAPYYANPTVRSERQLKGQAIWSGHFKNGKQTFLAYHWLMRMDGSFERLLQDDQIGWHAGNWDINKRSVAICLDNDYEDQDPSPEILEKLAAHIKKHYPSLRIIGHSEAREGTICPGSNFIGGWKDKLLEYLE